MAPKHVFGQQLGCPAPVLATLHSATSAKVVNGELLRLCPGLSKGAPHERKPKTDCHDAARAGQLFGGYKSLEISSTLCEGSALPDQTLIAL